MAKEHLLALKAIVQNAPICSGVYLWKSSDDKILYIGKAKNIKARLNSYFHEDSFKTQKLMENAFDIEFIVTNNEYEALILENNLIKEYKPKYNIRLKDQKTYPSIAISKERFPRVFKTRNLQNHGFEYFGPYPLQNIDTYLKVLNQFFAVRKCKPIPLRRRKIPCIYAFIGNCTAPCVKPDECDKAYRKEIKKIRSILEGNASSFVKELRAEMNRASKDLNYERAAEIRDALQMVDSMYQDQRVQITNTEGQVDYIGAMEGEVSYIFIVLKTRDGTLVDKATCSISNVAASFDEALTQFICQYYTSVDREDLPAAICMDFKPDSAHDLRQLLLKETGRAIELTEPAMKSELNYISMANDNAVLGVMSEARRLEGLAELQEVLNLPQIPDYIEGIDIAQLHGFFTVASLIVFKQGAPSKKEYRKFKMKSFSRGEINDFKAVSEATTRRMTRLLNDQQPLPDLLMIDGGKGQVSAAYKILVALNIVDRVTVVGLAKRNEELYLAGADQPLVLPKTSEALKILQQVRDETHRFATAYNQKLRTLSMFFSSFLKDIKGVGPEKSKSLLMKFGTFVNIVNSPAEEIALKIKVPLASAEEIIEQTKRFLKTESQQIELLNDQIDEDFD